MEVTPDLAGFKQAQEELRQHFGQDVTFHFAPKLSYPEGTPLDPESGRPYDPQIEGEEETPKTVDVKCNVAFRPVRGLAEDTVESPIGNIKSNECVLIMSIEQWETVDEAVAFSVKGDRYRLKKSTEDGIGSDYRQLVWGEREGSA